MTVLSDSPAREISTSLAFEQSVLASRLNSWARKSSLRPTAPLSPQTEGFSDVAIEGRPWRVFSTWADKNRVLIQVGEERAARDQLATAIATNLLTPLALALPAPLRPVQDRVRRGTARVLGAALLPVGGALLINGLFDI